MDHKGFSHVEIKAADKGTVEALFSRFNVIDHDRDVTLPGAFKDGAAVRISAYNHTSQMSALPVGKGTIRTTKDGAILDGQFFLDTTAGRDTFSVVKQMGDLQEWSYGYDILQSSFGQFEGEDVQFLSSLDVHEVSPVLLGAGIDTRTLTAKAREDRTFSEEAAEVLAGVSSLIDGAERVVALRAEKGKQMSTVNAALLSTIETELKRLATVLRAEPLPDVPPEVLASLEARFLELEGALS